jgi:hypothetical protein
VDSGDYANPAVFTHRFRQRAIGLFIDHRKTRAHLSAWAREKTCLNLFCYTGSVSVALAAGGATCVDSIDMSKTYISKERSAMLKIAPLRKKRYPARGARKKQFPINTAMDLSTGSKSTGSKSTGSKSTGSKKRALRLIP